MEPNPARDQFLADQSARLGEPILCFTLAQVLAGPGLGAPLVFLLVGPSGIHFVPAPGPQTLFGIAMPSKPSPEPPTQSFARPQVVFGAVRPGWWGALTAPRDRITVVAGEGPTRVEFLLALTSPAPAFLSEWQRVWAPAEGQSS